MRTLIDTFPTIPVVIRIRSTARSRPWHNEWRNWRGEWQLRQTDVRFCMVVDQIWLLLLIGSVFDR